MSAIYIGQGVPLSAEFDSPAVIGGKAASLVQMTALGLNVPPAIVIPCALTFAYQNDPKGTLDGLRKEVEAGMAWIEQKVGRKCLFSVRSGAPISMPGMMDTVLNVGLNTGNYSDFAKLLGNHGADNSWTRLREMYGSTVLGIPKDQIKEHTVGTQLSKMSPITQIMNCVGAVFASWMSPRAIEYRKINNIPETMGTAVTIQAMVYGNLNDQSGSGVLFTRDPSTGERKIMAEYLANAQGEDVVAGTHDPVKLNLAQATTVGSWQYTLREVCVALEAHYKDMVDVEFTVENGKLYILQSRKGKRTHKAAVRIAIDLLNEGVVTDLKTVLSADQLFGALGSQIVKTGKAQLIGKGLPAGGGVAKGKVVCNIEAAISESKKEPVILCREETLPDDIAGMAVSVGIVTMKGGATSHAAVVSRAMNKACVVGLGHNFVSKTGYIVVNGDTGEVWDWDPTMVIAPGGDAEVMELAVLLAKKSGVALVHSTPLGSVATVLHVADQWLGEKDNAMKVMFANAKKTPDKVIVDLTHPMSMVHPDDSELFDLVFSGVEKQWQDTVYTAVDQFSTGMYKEVVLIDPNKFVPHGDQVSQQVVVANTVAEAFSGKPVILPTDFVSRVVGSKDMMAKLVEALGAPKSTASRAYPYELIMKAIA